MLDHQPSLLPDAVLEAMWTTCKEANLAQNVPGSLKTLEGGLTLLSMATAKRPSLTSKHLSFLLEVKLSDRLSVWRGMAFVLIRPISRKTACDTGQQIHYERVFSMFSIADLGSKIFLALIQHAFFLASARPDTAVHNREKTASEEPVRDLEARMHL